MRSTFGTGYFSSDTVWIRASFYCSWDFFIETWPATIGIELTFRTIKLRSASSADICSSLPVVVEQPSEGQFGSFMDNYSLFFKSQLFVLGFFLGQILTFERFDNGLILA